MLVEEYTRLDPGKKDTKILINLNSIACCSPHYVEEKGGKQVVLSDKTCVVALNNGMVVLIDYAYKSMLQKLKNAR